MSRKLFLFVTTIVFCGFGVALSPKSARADVPLRNATIQELIRQVRLIPQNKSPRLARQKDPMTPGDALSTARSSRADLRFNDGSLAKLGELSLFKFTAGTRNFRLSNGTVLLLIPPGRGRTNINTPNASAGIRGSALFVRYDAETDTTIVGALTNNPNGPMDILNKDGSQQQALKAGQMVVIVRDRIQKLYEFDLKTFYETSELVKGLDLTKAQGSNPDAAIAAVQGETFEAFEDQRKNPIKGDTVVEGRFSPLSPIASEFYEESQSVVNASGITPYPNPIPDNAFKEGVQQPTLKPETPIASDQSGTLPTPTIPDRQITPGNPLPIASDQSGTLPTPTIPAQSANPPVQQPSNSLVSIPVIRAVSAPVPVLAPVTTPTTPIQAPVTLPVQAPTPIQAPVTTPIQTQIIPTPIQAPVTLPVQAPTPIQAPVTPPVQTQIIPTPIQAPVISPVQAPTPTQAPVAPPVQTPASTIVPTPALVLPPVQRNILQSLPNAPAAVQTPAGGTVQITTPQPATLVPALAPAATPESPTTTGQIQQTVK